MSFVAIDLGASNTRYANNKRLFRTMPNNMSFLETKDETGKIVPVDKVSTVDAGGEEINECLEAFIKKTSGDDLFGFFPAHVMIGYMSDSCDEAKSKPYPFGNKYVQRVNYISCIMATAISKMMSELDENIELYIALPPVEIDGACEKMIPSLVGSWEVELPKYNGGVKVNFNIVKVIIRAESSLAMNSFYNNIDLNPQIEHQQYSRGNVLSIDIGESTTDVVIFSDGKVIKSTSATFKFGGMRAISHLKRSLTKRFGVRKNDDIVKTAMIEGIVQAGSGYTPVTEEVNNAKRALAYDIFNEFAVYFSEIQYSLSDIKAIIVSGGGSMPSQYIDPVTHKVIRTSEPISKFLTDILNANLTDCDPIDVISHSDNPRFANIYGLYILAQAVEVNRAKAAALKAAQEAQANQ